MIGQLLKRFVQGAAFCVALVAFFTVPIGRKTASEHAVAILSTRPAKEAGKAVADTAHEIADRATAELGELRAAHDDPPPRKRRRARD